MKRKITLPPVPLVSEELLEQVKRTLASEKFLPPAKCVVCGDEVAPNSSEGLCWVCRRLKISAWRDSDQQIAVQE